MAAVVRPPEGWEDGAVLTTAATGWVAALVNSTLEWGAETEGFRRCDQRRHGEDGAVLTTAATGRSTQPRNTIMTP